jgi:hypothetical protein
LGQLVAIVQDQLDAGETSFDKIRAAIEGHINKSLAGEASDLWIEKYGELKSGIVKKITQNMGGDFMEDDADDVTKFYRELIVQFTHGQQLADDQDRDLIHVDKAEAQDEDFSDRVQKYLFDNRVDIDPRFQTTCQKLIDAINKINDDYQNNSDTDIPTYKKEMKAAIVRIFEVDVRGTVARQAWVTAYNFFLKELKASKNYDVNDLADLRRAYSVLTKGLVKAIVQDAANIAEGISRSGVGGRSISTSSPGYISLWRLRYERKKFRRTQQLESIRRRYRN